MGLRLNLKWDFPIHSHSLPTSPFKLPPHSSSAVRGRETSFSGTRLLYLSVISEDGENSHREPLKAYASSSVAPQILDNDFIQVGDMQINKRSYSGLQSMIEDNFTHLGEGISFSQASLHASRPAQFNLLMENLNILEETFADSNVSRLERDILLQLGRLGALKLFNTCLSSRTFEASNVLGLSDVPTEDIKITKNSTKEEHIGRIFVRSAKKDKRKSRRARVLENGKKLSSLSLTTKTKEKAFQQPSISSAKRASHSRSRRRMVAKNEMEMARGVKVITELERIRTTLEEGTGKMARLSCWAEAAGLDQKVLQQQLHFGWQCRDEIIRSTRSLVIYLARYYRRPGVAFEELLQAGNLGVLEGAKRFDPDRGCKFSTYVQYWIRKSMSTMVAQSTRDMHIPYRLSQALYQIRRAERALKNGHKYPDDVEIAKYTGLSLARIELARRCPRIVGSVEQKVGDNHNVNILDITPDTSIPSPEEVVMRQHMTKDIYDLLDALDPKESRVLVLRFGFDDHRPKSLGETGKLCSVSKEWIRKVEKKALAKLRTNEMAQNLRHYLVYIR
uniref:Sigma factor n=1 Tax=California macrophylla TaxID=337344 RepID=A0A0G2SWT7_9ROSI|nr:sigma factor [California macrophylla]